MTFKQVKICLWIMAVTAAIVAGINGYRHGYVEGYQSGKNDVEAKLYTKNNSCTIFRKDNKEIDGFCIETNLLIDGQI